MIYAPFGINEGYIRKTPAADNYIPTAYLLWVPEDSYLVKGHKILIPSMITLGFYHTDVFVNV